MCGTVSMQTGLGKTVEAIMLILTNPPPPGWAVEGPEYDADAGEPLPIKTTLVVVPPVLFPTWKDELNKHVLPNTLKW